MPWLGRPLACTKAEKARHARAALSREPPSGPARWAIAAAASESLSSWEGTCATAASPPRRASITWGGAIATNSSTARALRASSRSACEAKSEPILTLFLREVRVGPGGAAGATVWATAVGRAECTCAPRVLGFKVRAGPCAFEMWGPMEGGSLGLASTAKRAAGGASPIEPATACGSTVVTAPWSLAVGTEPISFVEAEIGLGPWPGPSRRGPARAGSTWAKPMLRARPT